MRAQGCLIQQVRHHVLDLPVGMAHAVEMASIRANKFGSTWLSSIRMTLHKVQTFTSVRARLKRAPSYPSAPATRMGSCLSSHACTQVPPEVRLAIGAGGFRQRKILSWCRQGTCSWPLRAGLCRVCARGSCEGRHGFWRLLIECFQSSSSWPGAGGRRLALLTASTTGTLSLISQSASADREPQGRSTARIHRARRHDEQ